LLERLAGAAPVDATLAGARLVAGPDAVQAGRDAGQRFRGELTPLDLAPGAATVWDGRFAITADAAGLQVAPLGGVMARLERRERARLKPIPAWARGALPALVGADGAVSLPRPLGAGPAEAASLAGPRFAAACGLIAREAQIGDRPHGAGAFVTLC
jgi:tRNA(Ile)-lysidine synthase